MIQQSLLGALSELSTMPSSHAVLIPDDNKDEVMASIMRMFEEYHWYVVRFQCDINYPLSTLQLLPRLMSMVRLIVAPVTRDAVFAGDCGALLGMAYALKQNVLVYDTLSSEDDRWSTYPLATAVAYDKSDLGMFLDRCDRYAPDISSTVRNALVSLRDTRRPM